MRSTFIVLALLALNLGALAQNPTPTPTAAEQDDAVVKISTNLVQIDVAVTDRRGNAIRDLRLEEIEIYENGVKQTPSSFSFISRLREREEGSGTRPFENMPIAPVRPEQVRRSIALVVDDLTLSFESTHFVRRALRKFVNEQMQPGDLVAIIRTGSGIGALQQFTTDKRQLHAAIDRVRWNASGSGSMGAFAAIERKMETGEPEQEPAAGERTREGVDREFQDFRESVFATGTLGAVNYIVRGMQELPGRKSIMLLSDGFSLFSTDALGFKESGRVMRSLQQLVDLANRASVVVYTMDARGVQVTGYTAADNTSGRSAEEMENEISSRKDKLFDSQAGLQYLARQTGGFAIINNNDLAGGIRKILDDQSYYLIGYVPDDETFDRKNRRFNALEVKVTRPGVQVRHRSGFFGLSEEFRAQPEMTGEQKLLHALSSPFTSNEITVRLNALFGSDERSGAFIRSLLHIDTRDLTFVDDSDGSKKGVFEIIAVGFGDNGQPIEQIAKSYTVNLNDEMYRLFLEKGIVYDLSFPIKKAGAYQLRIAIRDTKSNHVGSANQFVEVPNLKDNRLTLTGLVLESLRFETWRLLQSSAGPIKKDSDPLIDTSLRRFKRGNVLTYGLTIHNAISSGRSKPDLTSVTRLFYDGKLVYTGSAIPVIIEGQKAPKAIAFTAALSLGLEMQVGDYLMEVAITDNNVKGSRRVATQYVEFELVE